jgi:hypothetical protein
MNAFVMTALVMPFWLRMVAEVPDSMQVAPFWHSDTAHSSVSKAQLASENPAVQTQM